MIENRLIRVIYIAGWSIILLAADLLFFITLFFLTVSFIGPIARFALSFFLSIGLGYYFLRFSKLTKKMRWFLSVVPPLMCMLFFIALGIAQNSN